MIGQVLVWRIQDTYKASFDIDNASENVVVKSQSGVVVDQLAQKKAAAIPRKKKNDLTVDCTFVSTSRPPYAGIAGTSTNDCGS